MSWLPPTEQMGLEFESDWGADATAERIVWVLYDNKMFLKILPLAYIFPDGTCQYDEKTVVPWFEAKEFK